MLALKNGRLRESKEGVRKLRAWQTGNTEKEKDESVKDIMW